MPVSCESPGFQGNGSGHGSPAARDTGHGARGTGHNAPRAGGSSGDGPSAGLPAALIDMIQNALKNPPQKQPAKNLRLAKKN